MHKIHEISKENLDKLNDLDGVIASYFQYIKENFEMPSYPLKERLRKGINDSKIKIYVVSTDNLGPVGFTVVNQIEGRFSFILDQDALIKVGPTRSLELEIALFEAAFTFLKSTHKIIRIFGRISINLEQHVVAHGFSNYKRARMDITREKVAALADLDNRFLSKPDFHLTSWTDDMLESFADLMAREHFHPDHPDGYIFAQYTGFEFLQHKPYLHQKAASSYCC